MISWHSELTTDAELSGADKNGGINWIKEPMSGFRNTTKSDGSNTNWADFSSAFPADNSSKE